MAMEDLVAKNAEDFLDQKSVFLISLIKGMHGYANFDSSILVHKSDIQNCSNLVFFLRPGLGRFLGAETAGAEAAAQCH